MRPVNKVDYGKKRLIPDFNTPAYHKGQQRLSVAVQEE